MAIPGTYHLANNPRLYEPQRTNNFELHVTGLENLIPVSNTELDTNVISNGSEVLRLSVQVTTEPSFNQNVIDLPYGNNTIKFAGKPTFKDLNITLNDYIGADTKNIILAWQRLSYDVRTQKIGRASDYKKTAYLIEYTPDYNEIVRTWRIIGCWLSSVDFGDFSMDGSDKKMITGTVTYDYAYPEREE